MANLYLFEALGIYGIYVLIWLDLICDFEDTLVKLERIKEFPLFFGKGGRLFLTFIIPEYYLAFFGSVTLSRLILLL